MIIWTKDEAPVNDSGADEFECMTKLADGRDVSLRLYAPEAGHHEGWQWTVFFDTGALGRSMSEDASIEGECMTREAAEGCVQRAVAAMQTVKRRGVIDPDAIERAAKGDA